MTIDILNSSSRRTSSAKTWRVRARLHPLCAYLSDKRAGNNYYEYPSVLEETLRTKRVVKYRAGADMLTYVAGKRRLPVQWSAWLTHTRPHPPSLEELHADIARQRRVLQNAALIEARDREERALQLRMAPDNREAITEGVVNTPAKASQQAPPANVDYQTPMSDEPQTWTPRAIRRG
ncbi:hypothetical protein FOMPIDRAFT_1122413 [Fomitopsis schrenkii]|uniref:NADH dehydrogenase [ubiquinone] 1 alpha subcomplex subunit n=1 Tax=Fomitopsis schrenkii TaxID=2126942 RepID=S8E7F8_FOMSC|nr:hypothetical protein FOMPIDRAFT_1122413 [Fomitopsis schrenkii]